MTISVYHGGASFTNGKAQCVYPDSRSTLQMDVPVLPCLPLSW